MQNKRLRVVRCCSCSGFLLHATTIRFTSKTKTKKHCSLWLSAIRMVYGFFGKFADVIISNEGEELKRHHHGMLPKRPNGDTGFFLAFRAFKIFVVVNLVCKRFSVIINMSKRKKVQFWPRAMFFYETALDRVIRKKYFVLPLSYRTVYYTRIFQLCRNFA